MRAIERRYCRNATRTSTDYRRFETAVTTAVDQLDDAQRRRGAEPRLPLLRRRVRGEPRDHERGLLTRRRLPCLGLQLGVLGRRHVGDDERERRPLLQVEVRREVIDHRGQRVGGARAIGGEVAVGPGHGRETVTDLLQDPVELAVLRDQLVAVHPVGADPGGQCREEELVLVGVMGDELFPIPFEVLADTREARIRVAGLQVRDGRLHPRAVDAEGLVDQRDEDEIGLRLLGAHGETWRSAVRGIPVHSMPRRLSVVDGRPVTEYAKNGDVHIAYQVLGDGPLDLMLIDSWVHHVEAFWEIPELARQRRRLAAIGRLIIFDRRGTGLSDPVPLDRLPDLETQVSDICAVMDAAGSTRAAILGFTEGGPLALLLAASVPQRCRALVLCNTAARLAVASDYPWGAPEDVLLDIVDRQAQSWASGDAGHLAHLAPSRADDPRFTEQIIRLGRGAVSPGAVAHYYRQSVLTDVRDLLPGIEAPTLVLQRTRDQIARPELGRFMADRIPDARYVELDGTDHLWFTENTEVFVDEVEEFLTGTRTSRDPDRMLATVLLTDIVGSTAQAVELGDTRWRALLDEHDAIVRQELARFGGREIDATGDGFLATFDGPGQAIRCARAIGEALAPIGVAIRAGVHTGEVEVRGARIGGLAVHIGARVSATAGAGEIVVSSTVKDLLAGSEVTFADRGEHELKGVPGTWHLYAAEV